MKKVEKVPNICRKRKPKAHFKNFPDNKDMPIRLSKVANIGIQLACVKICPVREQIVEEAKSSAGLRPTKNLTIPNQRKIIPMLHLKKVMALAEPKWILCFII
jgi:hypothetical protein